MRILTLIPLALLTTGCWTPGPGQIDPSRYPWDQQLPVRLTGEHPHNQPARERQPKEEYCLVAIEPGSNSGIVAGSGQNAMTLGCGRPPSPPPAADPSTALGPAYVMQEVGNGFAIRVQVRELTAEEIARIEPNTVLPSPVYTFTADPPVLATPPPMTTGSTGAPSGEPQDEYIDITCHPPPRPPGPSGSRC